MPKRFFSVVAATAVTMGGLFALFTPKATPPAVAAAPDLPPYVPGEILVQFKEDATPAERSATFFRAGLADKEHIFTRAMRAAGARGLIVAATRGSVPQAVEALQNDPAVEFAEPNWIYTHSATSNDPYYTNGSLWGMYGDVTTPANQYGSQAGQAWMLEHTGSKSVIVGVIDEGIQVTHPDLQANIWVNPYDNTKDGVDNDGNGYVDDINGWDFVNNDNTVYDGGKRGSQDKHGTHVAGTIGAVGGNGAGVVGVNWNVTMISCKFLGRFGGSLSNAIKAVDYLTDLKTRHGLNGVTQSYNLVASNNSWGGGGYSQALLDAITRAAKAEMLFIAAAGNDGANNDTTPSYPSGYDTTAGAGYDAVIAVAALVKDGTLASYSNYGLTTVDLGAPGSSIYSTLPSNTYGSYSGTSMATPHVTGGAALYAATYPGASALTIKTAIINAATLTPTLSLSGKTVTGGRLNVSGF